MCGRARCTLRPEDVARACGFHDTSLQTLQTERYRPSYNVSPGSFLPVLCKHHKDGPTKGVVLHCMKWGLVPSFTKRTEKPDHFRMFNARSESIGEKASFRRLVPSNRCLVAVEGFYEWKKDGPKKQPFYIYFKDQRPLVFAVLYDSWTNSEGEVLNTFTILTTRCSPSLQWLHDRMPVIMGSKTSIDAWLSGSTSIKFDDILVPYEEPDLVWYPVTPEMGKISFNGPDCVKEIKLKTEEKPISKFFTKKTADIKKESDDEVNKSSKESSLPDDVSESLQEEPGAQENLNPEIKTLSKLPELLETVKEEPTEVERKEVTDFRQEISDISPMEGEIHRTKRDFELSVVKSEWPAYVSSETHTSSAKKGKTKNDTGKRQSTLHSFFGTK